MHLKSPTLVDKIVCSLSEPAEIFFVWLHEAGDECSFQGELCNSAAIFLARLAANDFRMDGNLSLVLECFCVSV